MTRLRSEPPVSVEAFLARYPADVRAVCELLRRVVRSAVPDACDRVYPGWKLIGYRASDPSKRGKSHYFAFIARQPDCVRLGFEYGALMKQASRLSDGGTCRQVRFVEVRSAADVDPQWLRSLLQDAAAVAVRRTL